MKDDTLIQQIIEHIVTYCNPDRILLFGSYAKGQPSPFSDIDLLIIKNTTLPAHRRSNSLQHLFFDCPLPLDLLLFSSEEVADELKKPYSFISTISRSWIEVYNVRS